jgi:hypothetical protein
MIQLEIIFMIRFDGFSCELNFDTFQECLCLITDFKSSSFLDKNRVIHRHHIIPKSCGGNTLTFITFFLKCLRKDLANGFVCKWHSIR